MPQKVLGNSHSWEARRLVQSVHDFMDLARILGYTPWVKFRILLPSG
jgi:hypothetical protein